MAVLSEKEKDFEIFKACLVAKVLGNELKKPCLSVVNLSIGFDFEIIE